MPALAQASSCWPPFGAPLRPTPPIVSSPNFIGTPPCWGDHVRQHALARDVRRFCSLGPLQGGSAECLRRICLTSRQFDIVRRRIVALQEDLQSTGAIDDGD